jgi:transcriptional regulator with XRE-family HTH domain
VALVKPEWKKRMDTHRRIGRAIREQRQQGGLTQTYLAKFIGCVPSAISQLELGKFGSVELIEAVTWALGIDLGSLNLDRPRVPTSINRARRRVA